MDCGCHPEIVERVWDQIGPGLPVNCRCMVHGTPAAHVAPRSGIVLAVAWGTQYILRLSEETMPLAIKAGAKTTTKWTFGGSMDVAREFGNNWVFGHWLKEEPMWCRSVYQQVEGGVGSAALVLGDSCVSLSRLGPFRRERGSILRTGERDEIEGERDVGLAVAGDGGDVAGALCGFADVSTVMFSGQYGGAAGDDCAGVWGGGSGRRRDGFVSGADEEWAGGSGWEVGGESWIR